MNFAHVLSWGSSVRSLCSLECSSSSRNKADGFCGNWQQRWPRDLTVISRSSNGNSRRTNGYNERSTSSNAVSIRPRGPSEQNNNGNQNNRRGLGGPDGNRSGAQNSRDLEQRYGGGRSSSGVGEYRGRGNRRDRESKMHPGAYKMRDEQTGDLVVVWGVETDNDIPMPTAADLNWRKSTVALPGDTSEETWAKVIEKQTLSDGSFRVRGLEP